MTAFEEAGEYDPVVDAGWKKGEAVPFGRVCSVFSRLEGESGRLLKIEMMSQLFRSILALTPEDLLPVIYFCINRLGASYEGLETGVGDALLVKAISETTGKSIKRIRDDLRVKGDLGMVAEANKNTQPTLFKPKSLTVRTVFDTFTTIAKLTGAKVTDRKLGHIKKLLASSKEFEARYLVRSLQGQLRIGSNESTVISALARAIVLTPPENLAASSEPTESQIEFALGSIKKAYSELPCWDKILDVLLHHGVEHLSSMCKLTPGIPVKAMLARPTTGVQEILTRFKDLLFTVEYKYDGERAQIHLLPDGTIKIFSRNAEDHTNKYPELVPVLKEAARESGVQSFIMDSEVVAYDRTNDCIRPFQILSTRKRKNVSEDNITVQVCIYAFDMLFVDGESLLQLPFFDRRQRLQASIVTKKGEIQFAQFKNTTDMEEVTEFLQTAVEDSCEGLMVKTLHEDATYEPDKRSHSWLKLKKDYILQEPSQSDEMVLGDSFDLVPIGAFHGKGKRTGVYGAFLLACYDEDNGEYQSICKVGTGMKEADLESLSEMLKDKVTLKPRIYYKYPKAGAPDVWFDPSILFEIKAADLSISPNHVAAAGRVHPSKGIALRFPRFLRVRTDKSPEDATSAEQVVDMYNSQHYVN